MPYLQPTPSQDLNFTIANPLASNPIVPLEVPYGMHHRPTLFHGAPPPAAANPYDTSTPLPSGLDTTSDGAKRSKSARMRPTKTMTARNLCAQEWVKNNPQGTTDDFKVYYNNLPAEQKQVWEDKSKASS
ncbi:hypothetical protein HYPSUDRAFT_209886 [Hypholoma sublateritium FD-334 SS-4]|uniref:Uncharacterized protein n=1 Tax=Hypholoma sublateritium (strain FD-334 SS-4) TaxID=945553 RepID=A0A0D2KEY1_HYPSF|nr:hypothetical protein HYPSUDRAFT_209886 [Hypholoma sublateritium FD-334 SS-4]